MQHAAQLLGLMVGFRRHAREDDALAVVVAGLRNDDLGVTTRFVQNCTLSRRDPVLCDDARHSRRADAVEPGHLGAGFAA